MTIIEALHTYFRECPLLDWAFRVEENPADFDVKRYTGGDAVWQKLFTLRSEAPLNEGQIRVEHVQNWLEAQHCQRNFPALPEGMQAQRLECLGAGYLYTKAGEPDRYQIQIRLTYYTGGTTR